MPTVDAALALPRRGTWAALSAGRRRDETGRVDRWAGAGDGELVAATLRGEVEAYGELVRHHQPAVYNVAYRLVGDQQAALDLAQDTFVRAYQALRTFDRDRPFGPWIKRIATNVAIDWLQRRTKTVPLPRLTDESGDDAGEEAIPDVSGEPERLFLASEARDAIRRAILALPVHYRAVVELRHFQDLTYDEIATTLGIPLSDVKSHLFRARRQLRRWLEASA